jgi:hypothetical protein
MIYSLGGFEEEIVKKFYVPPVQETLEIGLTTGKVATVATPLLSTTLQGIASGVAIGKFAFDGSAFVIGLIKGCHE